MRMWSRITWVSRRNKAPVYNWEIGSKNAKMNPTSIEKI